MRRILVSAVVVLGALTMAGCSSQGSSTQSSSGSEVAVGSAPSVPAPADAGGGKAMDLTTDDRQVVTTGSVYITADDPIAASDHVVTIVEGAGGRIDARQQNAPVDGDKGSATLTLRIPSATLTATLDSLEKLGTVQQVSLQSNDVTRQSQDLDARISASRTAITRLLTLMEKSATTADLIQLETAVADRQGDLESMEAQQRSLADQVSMSTVALTLGSVATAPVKTPDTFLSGLVAGWNAFVGFLAGLLVVIGVALPWLVFAAVVTAIVLLFVRVRRRAIRRAVPPASEPA